MKKLFKTVMCAVIVVMLFFTSVVAYADTYEIPGLDMSIDISMDYMVATREVAEDAPLLRYIKCEKADLIKYMEQTNAYMYAILVSEQHSEISITASENEKSLEIGNLRDVSDKQLDEIVSEVISAASKTSGVNIVYENNGIYEHPQARFLKFTYERNVQDVILHGVQYSTIVNGKTFNVSCITTSEEISKSQQVIAEEIVKTIDFHNVKTKNEKNAFAILLILAILVVIAVVVWLLFKFKVIKFKQKCEKYDPIDIKDIPLNEYLTESDNDDFSESTGIFDDNREPEFEEETDETQDERN